MWLRKYLTSLFFQLTEDKSYNILMIACMDVLLFSFKRSERCNFKLWLNNVCILNIYENKVMKSASKNISLRAFLQHIVVFSFYYLWKKANNGHICYITFLWFAHINGIVKTFLIRLETSNWIIPLNKSHLTILLILKQRNIALLMSLLIFSCKAN